MTSDLRYAMGQLARARQAVHYNESGCRDCIQRAMDALERLVDDAAAFDAARLESEPNDVTETRDAMRAGR